MTTGDLGGPIHDQMAVYLEGTKVDTITTASGQVLARTYTVSVTDGQLTLRMQDLGGSDPNVTLIGLDVVTT